MLTGVNDACLHGKRVERVFSLIVFGLILWLYWSTWRLVLHPWLVESYQGEGASQDGRVGSIIFMTIYHLSCWMTIWSMIVVTNTSPGFVPDNYQAVASGIGGTDWCLKCEQARPARAHHCRYCRRCILRMDHHCPWIGNCVGYWNHGHFLRFLTYASLSCLLALTATSIRLFRGYFIYEDLSNYYRLDELNEIGLIVAIINAAFTLCILMMLLILTVYQWSNSLWNMTTIEHLEWEAANDRAIRHRLPEIVFPYRFESKVACLKVILGDRIWAWPLPLPSRWLLKGQGNGIFFAHRPEINNLVWPPKDLRVDHRDIDDGGGWESASYSEPNLTFGRGRFRRGSEGYLIPANQIGVKYQFDPSNSSEPILNQTENI